MVAELEFCLLPNTLAKLEGVLRMGLGIRKFLAAKVMDKLPPKSFNLMIAGQDQYIPRGIMDDFWANTPEAVRGAKILVYNSEHKMPEAVPKFAAALVN